MSDTEGRANDDATRQSTRTGDEDTSTGGVAEWITASALRVGLAITGFVLLLFALGQAVGFDLLGLLGDALNSRIGRWLVVAFFALLLIGIALRGFDFESD